MNNKKLGNDFEREFEKFMRERGYWVHFCAPNAAGAQPCDFIAVKDCDARLIDCKTSAAKTFSIRRLEDNQINAFERWQKCGNCCAGIAIKYKDEIYYVNYTVLKLNGKITLNDTYKAEKWL